MTESHTFEEISLADHEFANLLGISVKEFLNLDRSELFAYIKENGIIEEYFVYIHPDSPADVIFKLRLEKHNFIRFSPEQVRSAITLPKTNSTLHLIS